MLKSPELKHVQAGLQFKGWASGCPVHYTFDYAHDVAVIGVGRKCLGRPRWVRLGAYAMGDREPNNVDDDAARERVVYEQHGHPTVSPRRLTRGTW